MRTSKTMGVRYRMRRGGSLGLPFRIFALSAALTFAFASAAFADTVTNLLDNSPANTQFEPITINEGETRAVPLRVFANDEDGEGGCNIDGAAFISPPNPEGLSVGVKALDNDADPDNRLDPSSVEVVEQPRSGRARGTSAGAPPRR